MTHDRLFELFEAFLENRLTPSGADELRAELRSSPLVRQQYWDYVEQHAQIADILSETRGRDLALLEGGVPVAPPTETCVLVGRATKRRVGAWAGLAVAVAVCLALALGLRMKPEVDLKPTLAQVTVPLGTIDSLAGHVQLTDTAGNTDAIALGQSICDGQSLRVGDEQSRAEVRLSDGTQLILNSNSVIRFASLPALVGTRVHLEQGAIQVQSTPRPAGRPLIVTTDHTQITALESRFRLYLEKSESLVELEVGMVRLDSPTGGNLLELREGTYVVATKEAKPMVPESLAGGQCRLRCNLVKAGDAVAFSQDGTALVASHRERGLRVWNTRDGSLRSSAAGHGQLSGGMAFSSSDDATIALGNGGAVALWKIAEPRAIQTRLFDKELRDSTISENGRWLAQAIRTGEVAVWELNPETGDSTLKQSFAIKPSRVAISATGSHVAVSQWGGEIRVHDVKTGRVTAQHKLKQTPTPLAVFADGRYVAAYANTEGLVLFDGAANTRRTLWAGDSSRVNHLYFTANGDVLLAGFEDGMVRGWSTESGFAKLVLETGHRHVNRVTATADLSLLATVGDGDCIKIWECKLP